MQGIKLAILDLYDNKPNQGMRCIRELVERFDALDTYEVFDVRGRAEVPKVNDFDIFISTGGPGSPHDGDGHWDKLYFDWLEDLWRHNQQPGTTKKYGFFICHSFQMVCKHFRLGKVVPRKSASFGVFPAHLTDTGIDEPVFKGLTNPFWIADFREWQVIQPDTERLDEMGADILALEKIRPHVPLERAIMAIRFSAELLGVQFHPEADPGGMVDHFLDPERRRKIVQQHSQEKYLKMMKELDDPKKLELTRELVIPHFIDRSIRALKQPVIV